MPAFQGSTKSHSSSGDCWASGPGSLGALGSPELSGVTGAAQDSAVWAPEQGRSRSGKHSSNTPHSPPMGSFKRPGVMVPGSPGGTGVSHHRILSPPPSQGCLNYGRSLSMLSWNEQTPPQPGPGSPATLICLNGSNKNRKNGSRDLSTCWIWGLL